MLVDLDFDDIVCAAAVMRPDVALQEPHPVERLRRQTVAHLRQLLRVGECAAEPLEHDYEEWERRVDALMVLCVGLTGRKRRMTVDELRKNIESLPPETYDRTTYYEKWITSLTQTLIQRGVISTAELAAKMNEVRKRA